MKIKKTALATIAAIGILATGISLFLSPYTAEASGKLSKNNFIGVSKAKSIAVKDAKVNPKHANFYKSKLDEDDDRIVYDIEFYVGNVEYDYEIDARTGKILERDTDIEDFVIPQRKNTSSSNTNTSKLIGVSKAKSIAVKHANVNPNHASFYKSKLDEDDNRLVYDIEFYVGNVEYDYEIDAVTGKILEVDTDIEDFVIPQRKNTSSNTNMQSRSKSQSGSIGVERAKSIALNHAGFSASSVRFVKVELDTDDGIRIYEVDFKVNGIEYDYDIDARTGAILSIDIDD